MVWMLDSINVIWIPNILQPEAYLWICLGNVYGCEGTHSLNCLSLFLLVCPSTSAIVSGSGLLVVSGRRNTIKPATIAIEPIKIPGRLGFILFCCESKHSKHSKQLKCRRLHTLNYMVFLP